MSNFHRENLRTIYKFVSFVIDIVSCSNIIAEEHTDIIVQPQATLAKGYSIKE